jgi:D-3-phosphoglycerate dehydrogenase / 2-oxoglutarate reductase
MRQAASRIVLNYATGFSDRNKGVPHEPALGYVPLAGRPLLVHTHGWEGPPMRILVADRLPDRFVEAMERRGHACTVDADLTEASLPTSVAGMDVVVVRSTRVTAAVFAPANALQLVVRAGSGTNTIDCDEATRSGVLVANVPGRNSVAVAELTLGLLLAVDRAIPDSTSELRGGRWDKQRFGAVGRGLYGRSLGIVGLGNIGLAVAERAAGFGMRLLAQAKGSRSPEASQRIATLAVELVPDLVTLASRVDVLTLHVPLQSQTRGMVGAEVLDALQPGILLNTSRAEVVDTEALIARLDTGGLSAGLDVFPDEPTAGTAEWHSPLASHPRVVGTHHVGASTQQAQEAVVDGVIEVISAYDRGELINVVNAPRRSDQRAAESGAAR